MKIQGLSVVRQEVRKVLEVVDMQGGTLMKTNSGHYKVLPQDKSKMVVFVPSTPSDHRSMKNVIGKLKRAGFKF